MNLAPSCCTVVRVASISAWQLTEELSRGGFGVVWRARDAAGRQAALKLLPPVGDPGEVARFQREVEALRRVEHPHVVRIHDAGVEQGRPWLAMELIEGESLEARLRRAGPLPPAQAVRVALELARALAAVHAQGLVHRDVKPANLVLEAGSGRTVLIDFGLSLALWEASRLTRTGESLGTPAFMAPEQVRCDREQGPAVDLWAAGATLHMLLTGEPPFGGGAPTAVMQRILQEEPAPPSRQAPGVTPALDALVRRCLAKRPAERFASARALEAALNDPALGRKPAPGPARALLLLLLLPLLLGGAALVALGLPGPSGGDPPSPVSPPAPPPLPVLGEHTLVICPDALEGEDTWVTDYGLRINDNFGAHGKLHVGDMVSSPANYPQEGDMRALLRFPLIELPAGAAVERAVLRLCMYSRTRPEVPVRLQVHRLAEDFLEGTSTNDALLDGVVWDGAASGYRYPSGDSRRADLRQPDVLADGPGESPPGAVAPTQSGEWLEFDLTRAVLRWLEDPSSNHGLRVSHDQEGPPREGLRLTVFSSDWWAPAVRPLRVGRGRGAPPGDRSRERDELRVEARQEARRILRQLEELGAPGDEVGFAAASAACRVDPSWIRPYLVRALLALARQRDGNPDVEAAAEEVDLVCARACEPADLELARSTLVEVVDVVLRRRPDMRRTVGTSLRSACPALLADPDVKAALARLDQP